MIEHEVRFYCLRNCTPAVAPRKQINIGLNTLLRETACGREYLQQISMNFELCCRLSIFIQLLSEILDDEKKFMEIVISWGIA